jgi:beta-N-acetylhexosaminidase
VPLVMASHALHPDLDPQRIASQSTAILRGLLRDRLRFRGACITDSLEAQAVVQRSSTPVAAARSMRAGCDLLLTTGQASYLQVLRRLVADARNDPRFRSRLAEARGRIAALHRALPAG